MKLSSTYYTLVPQVVTRSSTPPVIDSNEMVDKYMQRIDDLKNLKIAYSTINDSNSASSHIDSLYNSLKTEIKPLEKDSKMWQAIEDYVFNTTGSTHNVKVQLLDIYEICREPEKDRKFALDNVHLLWHGTRLSNYISILKNGLVLRPELISNAVICGKMFGLGCYAANSFSKSFNYCNAESEACLFLGEFSLGRQLKLTDADYNLSETNLKARGYDSVHGQGRYTPCSSTTIDNVTIPNGKLVQSNVKNAHLQYDEFIVYNESHLKLKYIIRVKKL